MKLSRKRCIAALAVVLLTGVCTINAVASGDSYNANEAQTLTNSGYTMQSKGIINTDDGKVVFDASDLNNLTAAVNDCFTSASNGKKAVADGLTNVGTYFTGEGTNNYTNNATAQQKSVTYNNGASAISNSENSDFINTDNIPFSTLMDAVSHSQDIPEAVKQTQATNEDGEYLYYEDETASIARDLTKVSTTNTGYPVYYGAVKPENLSAGSAAWVNGDLILGTGSDNKAYYEQNKIDIDYFLDTSNVVFGKSSKITIDEPGKYLFLLYVAGVRSGDSFSYWVMSAGYPKITNPSTNTFTKNDELEKLGSQHDGIKCFAYVIDTKEQNVEFELKFSAGSLGGTAKGYISQLYKLE